MSTDVWGVWLSRVGRELQVTEKKKKKAGTPHRQLVAGPEVPGIQRSLDI